MTYQIPYQNDADKLRGLHIYLHSNKYRTQVKVSANFGQGGTSFETFPFDNEDYEEARTFANAIYLHFRKLTNVETLTSDFRNRGPSGLQRYLAREERARKARTS